MELFVANGPDFDDYFHELNEYNEIGLSPIPIDSAHNLQEYENQRSLWIQFTTVAAKYFEVIYALDKSKPEVITVYVKAYYTHHVWYYGLFPFIHKHENDVNIDFSEEFGRERGTWKGGIVAFADIVEGNKFSHSIMYDVYRAISKRCLNRSNEELVRIEPATALDWMEHTKTATSNDAAECASETSDSLQELPNAGSGTIACVGNESIGG